jgi:hypothetical protein
VEFIISILGFAYNIILFDILSLIITFMIFFLGYFFFTKRISFGKMNGEKSLNRQYIYTLAVYWVFSSISDFQAFLFGGRSEYSIMFLVSNLSLGFFFLILFIIKGSNNKKRETYTKTIEKLLVNYLRKNTGKAYSAKTLLNKLDVNIKNPSFNRYLKKNGEEILTAIVLEGAIQKTQKDGLTHYFFPIES